MNLGYTNFADGGPPEGWKPGVYALEYLNWYDAKTFRDANGVKLPGANHVNALTLLNQLAFLSSVKEPVGGGLLGWDIYFPLIMTNSSTAIGPPGGLRTNRGVLGDLFFGPFIQWNDHSLFGMPYLHRFEVNATAPTGNYDKSFDLNAGSNLWTVRPYYAQTLWVLPLNLEISLRYHWLYSTENPQTQVRPGQAYHLNYAASYGITSNWRVGVNGYYLQQFTNDQLQGQDITNSKERVVAAGPGFMYITATGVIFMGNYFYEFAAENRAEGYHLQGRLLFKF